VSDIRIVPRQVATETESRIRAIISFLKQNQRWVTIQEIREHFDYPYKVLYITLSTLRVLGYVEEGRQTHGRGRPRAAFHWLNRKPSVARDGDPAPAPRGRKPAGYVDPRSVVTSHPGPGLPIERPRTPLGVPDPRA
jgi:hypothetical protein